MKKYRILERTDISGVRVFIPQYRKLFRFWCYYEMEIFPRMIKFFDIDSAKEFLNKQIQHKPPVIHKFEK
jgi:hypothetical protein